MLKAIPSIRTMEFQTNFPIISLTLLSRGSAVAVLQSLVDRDAARMKALETESESGDGNGINADMSLGIPLNIF
jgi:hypothetical protein